MPGRVRQKGYGWQPEIRSTPGHYVFGDGPDWTPVFGEIAFDESLTEESRARDAPVGTRLVTKDGRVLMWTKTESGYIDYYTWKDRHPDPVSMTAYVWNMLTYIIGLILFVPGIFIMFSLRFIFQIIRLLVALISCIPEPFFSILFPDIVMNFGNGYWKGREWWIWLALDALFIVLYYGAGYAIISYGSVSVLKLVGAAFEIVWGVGTYLKTFIEK